ncbi:hypothetical protein ACNR9Z_000508 [Candidozyma auris]|nr:hypothetical protein QG37_08155 [[Candida] auris]
MMDTALSLPTVASETGLKAVGEAASTLGEVGETPGMTNGSEMSLDKARNVGGTMAKDMRIRNEMYEEGYNSKNETSLYIPSEV